VLGAGNDPQATVVAPGAVMVGNAAGLTVITRDTDASGLPHKSVAVHVSVTGPPQLGTALKVDGFEVPLSKQPPVNPLVYGIVLGAGNEPHATVIVPGAVIVGNAAGLTVITLDTDASGRPQASVAVHVSVTGPPHPFGEALNVEGFDVPLSKQPPLNPFVYAMVLGAGNDPHATVVAPGAVIVGKAAGLTVITLDTDARGLPQISVAVHVSVTGPPHALGAALNVDGFEVPLIKQPPLNPLVNDMVLGAGNDPHATVVAPGAVIVGKAAGLTVITRDTGARGRPQASVAVHVSVTGPPHAPGVAVNVDRLEVPLSKQPPVNPLVYDMVLGAGNDPHATVVAPGAVIVGNAAGLTVITLDTDARGLPHRSVAVHVSVTGPPQPGTALNVDRLEVPLSKHPPLKPFVYVIVLGAGNEPHATVIGPGAVIVGNAAGLTVITLDTDASGLPHASVAVHVSVTGPPHALGVALNVDGFEVPLSKQPPLNPFVYAMVLGAGNDPHATVVAPGAVIVGNAAGLTVITLDTDASGLPHMSVAVHVSVTGPPHPPGAALNVDGFEVPLIKQPPLNPFVNDIVLGAGNDPHATVVAPGAVIVGNAAGLTVITLETDASGLPHASVAVHVSVTGPPHALGEALNVDGFEVPLSKQPPVNPLVYVMVLGAGNDPHATVIGPGAVIVGNAAGLTVITRDTEARGLPHISVAVHVSVTGPPQPGTALKVDGFEVPLIKQPPLNPFVNDIVLGAGKAPQATVIGPGAVIVGSAAGLMVIILDTDARGLPHASVAVHVCVTGPPHGPGVALNVDELEVPLIKHPPLNPFVNDMVLGAGNDPHATVVAPGAVIVGNAAGLIVITLDTGASGLPQASVAVHVSVTGPPHGPGVALKVDGFEVPLSKQPPVNPFV